MNMHSLPAGKVGEHQARIALGWNQPLDEYYAEVYAVQPNGKLGALPCATLDESFFPSDILQLTAWLVTVDAIHALSTLHPIKVTAGSKRLTVWFKDDAPKYGRC